MPQNGYYRDPTIFRNTVVFVCEDDLWTVPLTGGISRRLTTGLGTKSAPHFSPDGIWIAFTGTQEGCQEVYLMPAEGGAVRRLTFLDESALVIGWGPVGNILFSSLHESPFGRFRLLYRLSPEGGLPEALPVGPANFISYGALESQIALQRHGYGYISWKRYRGGTAGEIWADAQGKGHFQKLLSLKSNLLRPLWIQNRIYFLSDHEGHGNIYSCTPRGEDLKRHTQHEDFYVRDIKTDGKRIVYSCGGDLAFYDIETDRVSLISFTHTSTTPQKSRYFESPSKNLSSYGLCPHGGHLALTTRGRLFRLTPHKGPVLQQGEREGVRYRLACWLHSGERILVVRDEGREEILEIYEEDALKSPLRFDGVDWGRILDMKPSPREDVVLLTNHRNEILCFDFSQRQCQTLDRSACGRIEGFDWSPDGKWVVYSIKITHKVSILRLCNLKTGTKTDLTSPVFEDFSPSFDPEGKYLYFLSTRTFQPTWDRFVFDLHFSKGTKPYLITLQKSTLSPFLPSLQKEEEEAFEKSTGEERESKGSKETGEQSKESVALAEEKKVDISIDLEGIQDRILEFPVAEGIYSQIAGLKGKVIYISCSAEKKVGDTDEEESEELSPVEGGELMVYDFGTIKQESLLSGIGGFALSLDTQFIVYHTGKRLRVLKAGEKPEEQDASYKAGGWLDWSRLRLSVESPREWKHMFDEAWRLQKELFWTSDMSHVDWDEVYRRYHPLLERLATLNELTDLIADMQGELGSSHAYVWASENPVGPEYKIGQLGATLAFDDRYNAYRIVHIYRGDTWNPRVSSPFLRPGLNIREGDLIWAVAGQAVSKSISPQQLLVNQYENLVSIVISGPEKEGLRTALISPLTNQVSLRYRDWVQKNRDYVHEKTKGQVGYIHIPDMGTNGFSEFHRAYFLEYNRDGLIVDARFNGGGNVSGLLLEKLARKRLGFDQTRWDGKLPYPLESPAGPMVALSNEYTGSDGDIFCHSFKKLQLGPVIGKRTWGGVIGIFPRHPLLDGSVTTQPEYSFWFHDVGWAVENHGVDPDIEIDITPEDYKNDVDPQLDRGIEEVLRVIESHASSVIQKREKEANTLRPRLTAPKLPRK